MKRPNRRSVIADVALAAGVSKTTVSHALRGQGRVNQETRRRVQEIANKLAYAPSRIAQGLRTGRVGLIAIANSVASEITSAAGELSYFMAVANAAARTALDRGYPTILIPPRAQADWLQMIDIDGAIVMDPKIDDELLGALRRRCVPFVTIGRDVDARKKGWCVDFNYVEATALILDHFAATGSRQPALILSEERRSYSLDTLKGYKRWTRAHGVTPIVRTARESGAESAGYTVMARLLVEKPDIDAVFAPLDAFAVGALRALVENNRSVPDDVQVAAFDGVRAQYSKPTLTALSDSPRDSAITAVTLLLEHMRNPKANPQRKVLPLHIVTRQSTRSRSPLPVEQRTSD